jgi:cellulase/cellobiase CelA1
LSTVRKQAYFIDVIMTSVPFALFEESRSGQIGLRTAEGDWCNVLNAGLGIRPTTSTGNTLIDAIVWVKVRMLY